MSKSKIVRMALKGSAAAVALLGAVWGAQAVETKFGEVSIVFDTTVSMGASMRTADRETAFLSESNGGSNIDTRFAGGLLTVATTPINPAVQNQTIGLAGLSGSGLNREGSVNSDDGRLNYDAGDLFSANVKANHDLQMSWRNYKVFARGVEFYDFIQNDPDHTERSALSDSVRGQVGRDAVLLDAFVSADYTLGDLPLNVRAGKQVISWGEGTFILNGINVINPIDVTAFRRPGAEIKEGLLPVTSLYASMGLPIEGTSIAAYYMLDFEEFEIDAPGTAFSNVDSFERYNVDPHGNIYGRSFPSGSNRSGSFRRNCSPAPTVGAGPTITAGNGSNGLSQVAYLTGNGPAYETLMHGPHAGFAGCQPGLDAVDYQYVIPVGQLEYVKNTYQDEDIVTNSAERLARDDGQFGVRFNWFSDELGGTEFGFYYQNYHSRLPFVGFRSGPATIGVNTISGAADAAGRGTTPIGCSYAAGSAQLQAALLANTFLAQNGYLATGSSATLYTTPQQQTLYQNTIVADPLGYETTLAPIAAAIATGAGFGAEGAAIIANLASSTGTTATYDNMSRINCWLVAAQLNTSGILMDGSEILDATNNMSVYFEYPEDIQLYGFSFNTVMFGWGVQFEASYRPNAPFQLDTDQLTIAQAFNQCAGWGTGAAGSVLQLLQTLKSENCPYDNLAEAGISSSPNPAAPVTGNRDVAGYIENEMFTAQIGTTATFTSSEWWLDMMGADLGVLVTEVGMMYVPGVEDTWIDNLASPLLAGPQYQNTGCQATDLPLGGFLDLRDGSSAQCRPTDFSAGLVLLYTQQYNNAFDTGFVLSPQIVYSYDFEGTSPSPYSNYMEDRQALGLGLSGTLNNNFRVGVNYTAFFGGHINNKAKDQDYASFTASYSF